MCVAGAARRAARCPARDLAEPVVSLEPRVRRDPGVDHRDGDRVALPLRRAATTAGRVRRVDRRWRDRPGRRPTMPGDPLMRWFGVTAQLPVQGLGLGGELAGELGRLDAASWPEPEAGEHRVLVGLDAIDPLPGARLDRPRVSRIATRSSSRRDRSASRPVLELGEASRPTAARGAGPPSSAGRRPWGPPTGRVGATIAGRGPSSWRRAGVPSESPSLVVRMRRRLLSVRSCVRVAVRRTECRGRESLSPTATPAHRPRPCRIDGGRRYPEQRRRSVRAGQRRRSGRPIGTRCRRAARVAAPAAWHSPGDPGAARE